jgi:hypothetical protein
VVFAVLFIIIFVLHLPLLRLPYFWDEAGYYVPAARDLLLTGSVIPHTTVSNAHPPLVMAWLALCWKLLGFTPLITRSAMLALAAFSLLGIFRLAERVSNTGIAVAATVCTAVYPVFFAQSSLAQVDLPAAGLIFWGLSAYVEGEILGTALWFSLAAIAKETAILAPLSLAAWHVVGLIVSNDKLRQLWTTNHTLTDSRFTGDPKQIPRPIARIASLLVPIFPLAIWYAYHYSRTGYVFGNPEFFRYNVAATLNPARFLLALLLRTWQTVGYLHLWVLTGATLIAMWTLPPLLGSAADKNEDDRRDEEKEGVRPRIGIPVQMSFYVVVVTYVVSMSVIGGAVLARYMLPVVPLVIILCVSTLWRRVSFWRLATACVVLAFVAGWFWNPPYGFSPEDNLAYRDYIALHENAEQFLEARYPAAGVLTAWPASDELARPWLGYVTRPTRVVRIEDFSLEEVISAAEFRANSDHSNFEVALVFSTKYEPRPTRWDRWRSWTELKTRFFGFHRDLPPAAAAQILGGHIVFSEKRQGQWVAVIEMEQEEIQNAEGSVPR